MTAMNTTDFYNETLIGGNYTTRRYIWLFRVGIFAVGGACIECVGIVCNIIAIIVLVNFRSKSSAPFLLMCLSIFDSIYLLSMLFLENIPIMESSRLIQGGYRELTLPVYAVLYPTPFLMQTCTIYLVVIITLERFAVVAWPFVAHRICSIRSARIAVVAVVVFGTLYHIPTYRAYSLQSVWDNSSQTWRDYFSTTEFGRSTFYIEIYIKWINIIVNFALPFVLLMVFNYFMIISLRKSRFNTTLRRDFTMEDRRLTVMVFCMTSIFFVCELMAAICQIVLTGYSTYEDVPDTLTRFSAIADTCLLINSAVNFAIYCASGSKFRQTFVQLFCQYRQKPKKKQSLSSNTGYKTAVNSCFPQSGKPRRSTTESSLSSISNGTRSSKCTSSDSITKKLSVITTEGE